MEESASQEVRGLNINKLIEESIEGINQVTSIDEKNQRYIHLLETLLPYSDVAVPPEPEYMESEKIYFDRNGSPPLWSNYRSQHIRQDGKIQVFHHRRYLWILQEAYGKALQNLKERGIYKVPTRRQKFKLG